MSHARRLAAAGERIGEALAPPRRGLICYLPLGDPLLPSVSCAEIYVEEGVDVLELGIPVARPYRDGETIAQSMSRARSAHAQITTFVLAQTLALRERHPTQAMVWMTYAGAIPAASLVNLASTADVDGVLYAERATRLPRVAAALAARGISFPHFLPRDPPEEDLRAARESSGYVMVQANPGVTGVSEAPPPDSGALLGRLRELGVRVPIALGVGISEPDHVRAALAMGADAVIVGSAVVEAALRGPATLRALLRSLRDALDE